MFHRESLSNGSLLFAPFPARLFRQDVHGGRYRCVVSNSLGTIISRTVRLKPGQCSSVLLICNNLSLQSSGLFDRLHMDKYEPELPLVPYIELSGRMTGIFSTEFFAVF